MNETTRHAVDRLKESARTVTTILVTDDDLPDVIGEVQSVERRLAEFRRGLLAEAGPSEGDEWVITEARSAARTFNPSAILTDVVERTEMGPLAAIHLLINKRACELKWRWTDLKRVLGELGITLRTHPGEVEDGDDAHVGEVWKSTLTVQHKDAYL